MTNLDLLKADLAKLKPTNRIFIWTGWDIDPFDDNQFRQYLFTRDEMIAIVNGAELPPPTTIRVKTTAALNVRSAPVIGDNKVGLLASGAIIDVYEVQTAKDWYQIVSGTYANKWVSAQYVEKVT